MKKSKNIAGNIGLAIMGISYFGVICLAMSSANTKTRFLKIEQIGLNQTDTVTVHFIHGSIPKANCTYQKKRLGGYLGGHIEIEVDDFVFGFLYDTLPINYLPKNDFNSKFEKRTKKNWSELVKYDKITSIRIPVTKPKKMRLDSLLNQHLINEPYDYAFFGQRCTSSTAEILSDVGIINEFSNQESIVAFYYPKLLRRTMTKYANENGFEIIKKIGIECHYWE